MSSNEGITVEYKITVDSDGNAEVTAHPVVAQLRKGLDSVIITSNDSGTVIRYRATSPFAEPEIGPETILALNLQKGPFKCVKGGNHHFDCGFMNHGKFQRWGKTDGADTPTGPN